jgi:hypothetical protein
MTQMIALRPFRYAGKLVKPGSRFDVSKKQDAKILELLGHAKEFVPEPLKVSPSARQPVSQSERMMGGPADRMTGVPVDRQGNPSEPEGTASPDQKPTRRYRRRDMKAEE